MVRTSNSPHIFVFTLLSLYILPFFFPWQFSQKLVNAYLLRFLTTTKRLFMVLEGFQVRNPVPLNIHLVLDLLNIKSYGGVHRPPSGVVRKFGGGLPVEVSSSSSDHGSKLRGPSQNSLRVASERGVNLFSRN
ncbi:hypothetical protein AVEN_135113-1 [Araneus ventricosus]|uniref:Uncharacterized protein n=1 Tax=Araneus ventricosus TaxID=182803 RepID=A0A4Y2JMA4_ARAVE|nr:hypothetical protein AVEN_135113-1 [Araneus ventricosus]